MHERGVTRDRLKTGLALGFLNKALFYYKHYGKNIFFDKLTVKVQQKIDNVQKGKTKKEGGKKH